MENIVLEKRVRETRAREIEVSRKRKVVAKRPNGEDSWKVKMNLELSKTDDESFEQSIWGKEHGKFDSMGSTESFLGNTVRDVPRSSKHNTVPLEEENTGTKKVHFEEIQDVKLKMGKAVNLASGSRMRKREDNMEQYVPDKLKKMEEVKPVTYPSENALEMPADLREKRLKKNKPSVAADIQPMTILDLQANVTDICDVPDKLKKMEEVKPVTYPSENALEMPADLREKRLKKNKPSVAADIQPMTILDLQANVTDICDVPDKLKKMEKVKPVTYPSENALEMPADLREKRLKKNKPSVAADIQPMTILDLQANVTDICGKKPKNWHKKTEKGKLVTSPVENVVEMPADPREERSKENDWNIADNIHTMKLSYVQPNMMDPCYKKSKNRYKKTEKGKLVTNPSENAAWVSADLGEKRPKENQRSLFANVQITEISDVQANRIDLCGKNPKDHKKTKKEKLVTSPVEKVVKMPKDNGKVGAVFNYPQVHAERKPSVLSWASSNPGFQDSIAHGIIQSTMSQGRKPVKRLHAVDLHDPDSPSIKKMKQALANFAINPLKRRHEDRHISDSPRFKKRRVWDLEEQFEALSI